MMFTQVEHLNQSGKKVSSRQILMSVGPLTLPLLYNEGVASASLPRSLLNHNHGGDESDDTPLAASVRRPLLNKPVIKNTAKPRRQAQKVCPRAGNHLAAPAHPPNSPRHPSTRTTFKIGHPTTITATKLRNTATVKTVRLHQGKGVSAIYTRITLI